MALLLSSGSRATPDGSGGVMSSDETAIGRDLSLITLFNTVNNATVEPFDPSILGPDLDELVYNQTLSGVGPDLVTFLVNSNTNVVIFGVDSATVGALGGPTGLGDTSQQPDGSILVVYDSTSCGGAGSHVFDVNGVKIPDPPFIILAHELAHAKGFITGEINNSTPEATAEKLAIIVENQIRLEANPIYSQAVGTSIDLSQRSTTNLSGGCNPKSPTPPPGSDAWGLNCFIASAAYQSAYSDKVERLRRFRDQHLRDTKLGRQFFDAFYSEYYRYSPVIAQTMARSATFRDEVRRIIVDPFIEFMDVFEFYLMNDEHGEAFAAFVDRVLAPEQSNRSESDVDAILYEIIRLRSSLEGGAQQGKTGVAKGTETGSATNVIRFLAASILAHGKVTDYSVWVLIEPLLIHWSTIRERTGGADAAVIGASYLLAIDNWFGRLPSLPGFPVMSKAELEVDLSRLQQMMFRGAKARRMFGLQICRQFAGRTDYDVRLLLRETGFLTEP